MGISSAFQNAALSVHKAFGDINSTATYHSTGTMLYSPESGVEVETGGVNYILTHIIFTDYAVGEIDGQKIQTGDKKALTPAQLVSFAPKTSDYITVAGVVWQVMNYAIDPANAEWVLQVRR